MFVDIKETFAQQLAGWSERPIFERQWLVRDFKKVMGFPPEYFLDIFKEFEGILRISNTSPINLEKLPLEKMATYYRHQIELLKSYEKDKNKVEEYTEIMNGWIESIEGLKEIIKEILSAI